MARLRFPLLLSLTFLLLLARAGAQGEQPASLPPNQSTAELEAALGALTGEDPEVVKQRADLTATLENLAAEATLRSNIQSKRREIEEVPGRKANLEQQAGQAQPDPELPDPSTSTLEQLETALLQAQAEAQAALDEVTAWETEKKASATRLGLLPDEIARAKLEATQALESALSLGPEAQLKPHGQLALSKARLARASQEALETEQALLTALRDLDPLRSDRYQRRKERLTSRVDRLRTMVADLRTAQAEQAAQQASSQAQQLEERFPELSAAGIRVLKELALEIVQLSERGLPQQKLAADAALERAKRDRDAIQERYKRSLRRMQYGGLTEGMGRTLREDFEWLPKRRSLQDQAQQRRQELSECQLALLDIDTDSRSIADSEVALLRLLDRIGVSDTESPVALYVRDLLRQKAQLQADAQRSLDELANTLGQHQQVQAQIEKSANEYRAYIEGRILWIKSTRSAFRGGLNDLFGQAWQWLSIWAKPSTWTDILHSLRARGSGAGTFLFFALLLLALRRVIWRRREEMHKAVRSRRSDRFALTLRALAQTVLLALPLPLLLWAVASVLDMSYTQMDSAFDLSAERITRSAARALAEDEDQVVRSLLQGAGAALSHVALVVFALLILLGVAQEKGIGELHFRWNPLTTELVRRQMRWFLPVIVVLTAIYRALYGRDAHFSSSGWNVLHLSDTVGRVAFCLAMAALALFLTRIGHPESPIWSQRATRKQGLMVKVHTFWTTAAMLIPVALIVLALLGYYYTALRLDLRMQWSLGFGLVLVLVHHVLLRWLNITRWKLAVAQAREKAKARAAALAETPVESTESAVMPAFDEATVDLPALDSQTRQLFKSGVTIGALVGLYLIWASALPALEGLDNVQLWPELRIVSPTDAVPGNGLSLANAELVAPTGESGAPKDPGSEAAAPSSMSMVTGGLSPSAPTEGASLVAGLPASLTLGDVVVATLILLLTFAAARNLPGLLEISLLQRLPMDAGSRYAISTLVRYLIFVIGLSAASSTLGLGWERIQWLVAALTFGLAFGLQEIFANFVSGLIILLERPIRVGDVVTVSGTEGIVTRLRMRATTVQDWDRRELLIPNKEFITSSVTNWTLTDPITRVIIKVGVAYGSDVDKTRKILMRVAKEMTLVVDSPTPSVVFRSFGDSTLDFELRVFINNRDYWPQVVDGLNSAIDREFRKAGIEIAFPQRDLHIRSGLEVLGHQVLDGGEPKA